MSECQTKAGNQDHTLTLSHSHCLALSLTHSHSLTHLLIHSRYAEQLLFSCLCSKVNIYRQKLQCGFLDSHSHSHHITLSPDIRVHRAGSQLKMSERQTKALSLSHSLTLSLSHSLTLDMLNNFCFHA